MQYGIGYTDRKMKVKKNPVYDVAMFTWVRLVTGFQSFTIWTWENYGKLRLPDSC